MSPILLVLACAESTDTTSPTDVADTGTPPVTTAHSSTTTDTPTVITDGTTTDTSDALPPGLNGSPPAVALPAPVFTAVLNRDGTARTQAALTDGHPTVLWFYPAAGTAG